MAAKNSVFFDSNYFIALYNPADRLHLKASDVAVRLAKSNSSDVISNFILLEIVTVLSQRVDRQLAIDVGNNLMHAPRIEILHITKPLQERSWRIFQSVNGKNASFVDCSIIAAMNYSGIKHLLTFDITDFSPLSKKFGFSFFN